MKWDILGLDIWIFFQNLSYWQLAKIAFEKKDLK